MPLRSIPPVHRASATRARSHRMVPVNPEDTSRFKVQSVTPVRRQSSPPKVASPSIQNIKVLKTPHRASWEFPNGEFVVMVEKEEIHVEVRLGRFIDALLMTTDKEQ